MSLLRVILEQTRTFKKQVGQKPVDYHYWGPEDFVLQHGTEYEPSPLPAHIPEGAPSVCFANSILLAVTEGFRYVEGYATPRTPDGEAWPDPIHHAWNLDAEGRVVDSTWTDPKRIEAYIGVEFSYQRADYCTWELDGAILQCPNNRYEIFKNPWPGEDFTLVWKESPALREIRRLNAQRRIGSNGTVWRTR